MDTKNKILIREVLKSKSILITGASGFVGQVLIERLLKDCENVDKVFIFFRGKRGSDFNSRFEKFKSSFVFHKVIEKNPKLMDKLIPIEVDLLVVPGLGIHEKDLKMLQNEVGIVFHLAATIRFDEPIDYAVRINTIATGELMKMAKYFTKLEVFVHVSTAYSNLLSPNIEEIIYEPALDYKKIIEIVERNDVNEIRELNQSALKIFPNTYTLSKHLAEQLIKDRAKEIPTVILRPSIVSPAFSDPVTGWCSGLGTLMGVSSGHSTGLVRVFYCDENVNVDYVPCDFVANAMIAAAAEISMSSDKGLKVYNSTMEKQHCSTLRDHWDSYERYGTFEKYPSKLMVWFPTIFVTSSYAIFLINYLLFQLFPAVLIDGLLLAFGQKPFVVKVQKMIYNNMMGYQHFVFNQWNFDNQKLMKIFERLSQEEKKIFNFDGKTIDLYKYRESSVLGIRRHILQQDDDSLPAARRRYRMFYWLNICTKAAFFSYVGWKTFNYFY